MADVVIGLESGLLRSLRHSCGLRAYLYSGRCRARSLRCRTTSARDNEGVYNHGLTTPCDCLKNRTDCTSQLLLPGHHEIYRPSHPLAPRPSHLILLVVRATSVNNSVVMIVLPDLLVM